MKNYERTDNVKQNKKCDRKQVISIFQKEIDTNNKIAWMLSSPYQFGTDGFSVEIYFLAIHF